MYCYTRLLLLVSTTFQLLTRLPLPFSFFFFNDTATTEIYTLSLHDALPILAHREATMREFAQKGYIGAQAPGHEAHGLGPDRKSTRLNSSHVRISYAVFCLKKKNTNKVLKTACVIIGDGLSCNTLHKSHLMP